MSVNLPSVSQIILLGVFLSSCQKKPTALQEEVMRDEMHIVTLQQQVRLAESKWDRLAPLHREFHAEQFRSNDLRSQIAKHQARLDTLKAEIQTITHQQQQHEARFALKQKALREKAIGSRFDVFHAKDRVFHQVTITDVQEQGVVLTHRDGKARVAVENLSAEQIAAYGLDIGRAQIARNEEQRRESAFHSQIEAAVQKNKATLAANTPSWPEYKSLPLSYPISQPSKPSLLRQTPQSTNYRVRNQGRPRYYYVYPNCDSTYSSPQYTYPYWR